MVNYIIKATPYNVEKIQGVISQLVREDDGESLEAFIRAIDTLHSWGMVEDEILRQIELLCDELIRILDEQGLAVGSGPAQKEWGC